MHPKGLLISVVLLAVLGGAVWWSNRTEAAKAKAPSTTSPKIVTLTDDQVQEIRISKTGAENVDLRRDNGKWALTQPKPMPADPDAASSLVSSLSGVTADKVIEDKATDLSPYGLNKPQLDVVVTKKDGKTVHLEFGDDTPTNAGVYAMLAGDPHVYTVGSYVKSSLDKTENDLRDKRLLPVDTDKLTRVQLQAKGEPVEFGKNGQNEWQIVKPRPLRADSTAVDSLVGKLKDAKMDMGTTPADAAKEFASATRVATATVTDNSGTQTLEVRKSKDNNYYAKSSAVEGIYKITSDVGDGLNKGLDDFRNKKLFDFGFSDPTKVEASGVVYTKSGDNWMAGSKKMDNSSVQGLIDKLRDLTATKFADQGGGQPFFTAIVTSNNAKRVEKVTITKLGDQYFAQRENEPSIYELDGKAVTDLLKAAADVKEAAPEPAKKK